MSAQSPSEGQPPPKSKGLTPIQIGAGVGAALTCLFLLAVLNLSRPAAPQGGAGGGISSFLFGVWCAVGAMAGMAVVALVGLVRRRRRKADIQDHPTADAGAPTGAAVPPVPAAEAKAEGSGSPILRVAAGVLALLFVGIPASKAIHGNLGLGDLVLMGVLAFMFAWYAVRGRKGLPRFLTKKPGP